MPTSQALLDAAERLFTTQGVTATGVDTIVREAGVSKPTLYAQFGSKPGLVEAVYARRSARLLARLERLETIDEVIDHLVDQYLSPGSRGCAFLNAAAELTAPDAPARAAIQAEKAALTALLERRAREGWVPSPARVAARVLLVLDGLASRAVVGGAAAAGAAEDDARALIAGLIGR